jgi:hypothetical protein
VNETDRRAIYKALFASDEGKRVLEDLERVSNSTKIDADSPNANAAIYKAGQIALVQYIKNQMQPPRQRYIETKGI